MERIVERLLLLAKSEQQGAAFREIDVEAFLSDLFIRWSGVAPRAWRLDVDLEGRLVADPEALRDALDALLENAVKYTDPGDDIELAAYADGVRRSSDQGLGLGPRGSARRVAPHLRPLGSCRRRAHAGARRRGTRPGDRRRRRARSRRTLLRRAAAPRDGVPAPLAGAGCRGERAEPDPG